jgi:DNA-nicking Smr family endonuclease
VKRPLRHEEAVLWAKVAATVRPAAGRSAPVVLVQAAPPPAPPATPKTARTAKGPHPNSPRVTVSAPSGAWPIEPGRMRRIAREREDMGPRLDLHGLNQDEARARLNAFLARAHAEGWRAVMVITGKGTRGDGVLRRHAPEWLAAPDLRHIVAGVAEAHRRHGGEGALYVALKRRARD